MVLIWLMFGPDSRHSMSTYCAREMKTHRFAVNFRQYLHGKFSDALEENTIHNIFKELIKPVGWGAGLNFKARRKHPLKISRQFKSFRSPNGDFLQSIGGKLLSPESSLDPSLWDKSFLALFLNFLETTRRSALQILGNLFAYQLLFS